MAINGGGGGPLNAMFDVSVSGNAEAELSRIADAFRTVKDAAGETGIPVSDSANKINGLIMAGFGLESLGQTFTNIGHTIIAGLVKPLESAIGQMAKLETLGIGLKSAFRDLNDDEFKQLNDRIEKIAVTSPFAQAEVMDLVKSLKIVGDVDLTQQYKGIKGFAQSGIEFLTDLAAGAGRSMEHVTYAMRELLSNPGGSKAAFLSFAKRLDIGGKEQIEKALKGVGETVDWSTQQKSLETMFKFISMRFGGLTKSLTSSYEGMVSNIKDAVSIGIRTMGGGFFERVKSILRNTLDYLSVFWDRTTPRGKAFFDSMSGIFDTLGDVLAFFADKIQIAIVALSDFISQNPRLFKTIFLGVAVFGAILSFIGPMVVMIGLVGKMIGSLSAMGGAAGMGIKLFRMFFLGLQSVSIAMLGMIGIPALIYAAYKSNFGGFADFIDKAFMILKGFFQLLGSNEGEFGKIAEDLADALEKAGLLDFTISLFMIYGRLRSFFIGFADSVQTAWTKITANVEEGYNFIRPVIEWFGKILGRDLSAAGHTNIDTWNSVGEIIGSIVGYGLPALLAGIIALKGAAIAWGIAMSLANPMVWIPLAIAGAVAAIWTIVANWQEILETLAEAWDRLGDYIMNLSWVKYLTEQFTKIGNWFTKITGLDTAKGVTETWGGTTPQMSLAVQERRAEGPITELQNARLAAAFSAPDLNSLRPSEASSSKEPIQINQYLDGRLIHQSIVDQDKSQAVRSYAY